MYYRVTGGYSGRGDIPVISVRLDFKPLYLLNETRYGLDQKSKNDLKAPPSMGKLKKMNYLK